jgi:adenosylmethionine-8-amino-7-oxononanoate aminotransferase
MQPISALLVNERIYRAMLVESRKLGNFAHGYTYWAHPVAAAVALEVQRIYEEMDLVGYVKRVGAHYSRHSRCSPNIRWSAMCAASACSPASTSSPTRRPGRSSTQRCKCQ